MKVGICDDIKSELTRIQDFLVEKEICDKDEVRIYMPEDIVKEIDADKFECDIMIMDIEFEMENLNGIILSKMINSYLPKCQILYLTSVLEFAPDVYETEHCYFVMKNNMDTMLPLAMEKAVHIHEKILKQASIEVISGSHRIFIKQENIFYIEKNNRQTIIHTDKEEFICYQSLRKIQSVLNSDMVRCHAGYIVNLNHVGFLGNEEIKLANDSTIPIGRTYKAFVKDAFMQHWLETV